MNFIGCRMPIKLEEEEENQAGGGCVAAVGCVS